MTRNTAERCIAFVGDTRVAAGTLDEVAPAVKRAVTGGDHPPVTVFVDASSVVVELDLRGSVADVESRYAGQPDAGDGGGRGAENPRRHQRGRGRPKLGVVGKEVTLLPRHWAWLAAQRGGASVTLRKLVDRARRENAVADEARRAQDTAYGFMTVMVGNQPGFEEATRALYAGNGDRFREESEAWPCDVRDHARKLAGPAFNRPEPHDREQAADG
jgi:hypothetical protein